MITEIIKKMSTAKRVLRKINSFYLDYQKAKYKKLQRSDGYITVNVKNCVIKLYPQGQIAELLYTSNFEKEEINLVADFIKPNYNIIDIGANIGLYSILLRKLSKGNIICFEPSSESYERLIKNLNLNDIDDIILHKAALSNVPDQYLELVRKTGYKDGDRYLNTLHPSALEGDIERVFCSTLDSFTDGLKIDFIKIDIEGGELNAFKGAERLLTANTDVAIMFECTTHNCKQFGHERQDVFDQLKSLGFGIYAWDKSLLTWVDGEEFMNQTENFWAIRNSKNLPRS